MPVVAGRMVVRPEVSHGETPSEHVVVAVPVPEGVAPGQLVHVSTPDEQVLQVAIPRDLEAGQLFEVRYVHAAFL